MLLSNTYYCLVFVFFFSLNYLSICYWEQFKLASMTFIFFFFFNTFLLSRAIRSSKLILYFPGNFLVLESVIFQVRLRLLDNCLQKPRSRHRVSFLLLGCHCYYIISVNIENICTCSNPYYFYQFTLFLIKSISSN